jgi:hypothetical protein
MYQKKSFLSPPVEDPVVFEAGRGEDKVLHRNVDFTEA